MDFIQDDNEEEDKEVTMRKYKLANEVTTIELLSEINKHKKLTVRYCCNCHHYNGNCGEFAKEGTCKAYNYYKNSIIDARI